jgi:dihydropteroate synthase
MTGTCARRPAEFPAASSLKMRGCSLPLGGRTLVMGILNLTPDSFYDGGRHREPSSGLDHARRLLRDGADIIDVGGESSRPGAEPVDAVEEWRRIGPVVAELAAAGAVVSVDTCKAAVADMALAAGAAMINDISGGTFDPDLHRVTAAFGAGLVIMHIQNTPRNMQAAPAYTDLMGEIRDFLRRRAEAAMAAGVAPEAIVVDPGIGFGKRPEHNLEILARLGEIRSLGFPVLVGASRKSFIGHVTGLPPDERLEGSLGAAAAAVMHGADILRVHDVRETSRIVAVVDAILRAGGRKP